MVLALIFASLPEITSENQCFRRHDTITICHKRSCLTEAELFQRQSTQSQLCLDQLALQWIVCKQGGAEDSERRTLEQNVRLDLCVRYGRTRQKQEWVVTCQRRDQYRGGSESRVCGFCFVEESCGLNARGWPPPVTRRTPLRGSCHREFHLGRSPPQL